MENKVDYLGITLACVDGEVKVKPGANICIETKAAWLTLAPTPPSYEGIPANIWELVSSAEKHS